MAAGGLGSARSVRGRPQQISVCSTFLLDGHVYVYKSVCVPFHRNVDAGGLPSCIIWGIFSPIPIMSASDVSAL